jgi:D-alanyl-D-alanine carboxypeptidase/D-alanyl-D-alanine-endopeptidase (penicillin-binding protein 4)
MIKKYLGIILFLLLAPRILPQLNKDQIKDKINDLLKNDFFNSTTIAVDVYDLTSGEYLYRENESKLLNPASNMKLLTSAAGLIFLGPKYNFITSLRYTGDIVNHTLLGDLYVVGGFDPDFKTADLNKFITDIKKIGIKEISGNLYGDISRKDSVFWGWGWMWDDDPSTDAPYLSALNINSNSIDVYVTGSPKMDKANITTQPETKYVKIINNTTFSSILPQNISVTRNWLKRTNDIIVDGNFLPTEITENDTIQKSINIYHPDLYFLTLLKEKMEKNSIRLDGKIGLMKNPYTSKWISVFDRSYDSVMVNMNKHSDNLSAEMTLYSLAASFNTYPVSAAEGVTVIDSLLKLCGVNDDGFVIADGSGVSRYNLLSSEILVEVLKYIYYEYSESFDLFYNSLPVAGKDGTLSERMKGTTAEGNVHAKTGTLRGVSCLSGYVTGENNHLIAFSIIEQNFVNQTSFARFIQDQICIILSKYE